MDLIPARIEVRVFCSASIPGSLDLVDAVQLAVPEGAVVRVIDVGTEPELWHETGLHTIPALEVMDDGVCRLRLHNPPREGLSTRLAEALLRDGEMSSQSLDYEVVASSGPCSNFLIKSVTPWLAK